MEHGGVWVVEGVRMLPLAPDDDIGGGLLSAQFVSLSCRGILTGQLSRKDFSPHLISSPIICFATSAVCCYQSVRAA